jgi:FMN-dependent NADH-azoreductase
MSTVLVIESSPRGTASIANQLAGHMKAALHEQANAHIVTRNVADNVIPILDANVLGAFFTPAPDQTEQQRELAALSDALIAELRAADAVVISASMYNFSFPAQLKHYFDFVLRAGQTFRYTSNGPEGLLQGKRAVILVATGGVYSTGPAEAADFVVPYLKQLLAFVGISEVEVIRAEGLAYGPDAAKAAVDSAVERIQALAPALLA